MALNLLPINPYDKLSDSLRIIDENFRRILANGGGPAGPPGATGATGVGAVGPAGANGTNGIRGSLWTTGTGSPSIVGGELDDDQYLDLSSGEIYTFSSGSWSLSGQLNNSILQRYGAFSAFTNVNALDTFVLTDTPSTTPPNAYGAKLKVSTDTNHIRLVYNASGTEYELKAGLIGISNSAGSMFINSAEKLDINTIDDFTIDGLTNKYVKFRGYSGVNIEGTNVLNVGVTSTSDATNFGINVDRGIKLGNLMSFNAGGNVSRIFFQDYSGIGTVAPVIEARYAGGGSIKYIYLRSDNGNDFMGINARDSIFRGENFLFQPNYNTDEAYGIEFTGVASVPFSKYIDFKIEAATYQEGSGYDASSIVLKAGSIYDISGGGLDPADGAGGSIFLTPGTGSITGDVILAFDRDLGIGQGRVGIGMLPTTYSLEVAGNAYKTLGTGNWLIPSDRNMKEDIQYFEGGVLDKINSLKPASFRYIGQERTMFGFIAQDALEVLPELVFKNMGNYGMEYGSMDALLVAAIQELYQLFNSLK